METIIIALSPIVVAAVSQGVKTLVKKQMFASGSRKNVLRVIVALLSYGAVVGGAMLSGGSVDLMATETFAMALVTFLGSTGTYFLAKK